MAEPTSRNAAVSSALELVLRFRSSRAAPPALRSGSLRFASNAGRPRSSDQMLSFYFPRCRASPVANSGHLPICSKLHAKGPPSAGKLSPNLSHGRNEAAGSARSEHIAGQADVLRGRGVRHAPSRSSGSRRSLRPHSVRTALSDRPCSNERCGGDDTSDPMCGILFSKVRLYFSLTVKEYRAYAARSFLAL